MLAFREKSHYYETSYLYMLPKKYLINFGANVKVLLGIGTYIFKLVCALFIAGWLIKAF